MNCPTCGQSVVNNHAAGLAITLAEKINRDAWDRPQGTVWQLPFDLGTVTVVARSVPQFEDQGTESDAFIIFELQGFLFRKDGTCDSYGRSSWHGPLRPVRVGQRVMKLWEEVK